MPAPDITAVVAAMRETAVQEILPRFRRLDDDEMWRKEAGSLATVADMAAEKRLSEALGKLVPGARILAEEDVESNPAALHYLADDDPLWVIDPIDGTANFAAGREGFVIIVAYFAGGEVRAGWIHDPLKDVTVTAEAGAGAWSDGRRLAVAAAPDTLADMRGALRGRLVRETEVAKNFAEVFSLKSCGAEYMALAGGGFHFSHYRGLKPWDHMAGELIHREAGGFAACLDGRPYHAHAPGEGGLLMAPDQASWNAIAGVLKPALSALPPRTP
jgi:fructose-1,6-bisphosphatase/inositol monophosphatase family enzyme